MRKHLFTILLLMITYWSLACSCDGRSKVSVAYNSADLVVLATVVDSQIIHIWSDTLFARSLYNDSQKSMTYREFKERHFSIRMIDYSVEVDTLFKQDTIHQASKLIIRTGLGGGDCGVEFEIGESYLIYAYSESSVVYTEEKLGRSEEELQGIYNTNDCTRTHLRRFRKEDIDEILKIKK
ncbi:hypothetical protein SAMN05216474_1769 [Lishizhenia tianjinensis]|uniref:Lipoprotein n=1 Tax=Lishizhenia tianjinensis TaxID=477690 RepID=A0A1I6ZZT9_9FLAO|nr:hypothetical protein [Lishizhenia tianjinensis]SFT68196.1 hypothetical protein SAMN05216474_1769 [Lishizhenia tianjinensis]